MSVEPAVPVGISPALRSARSVLVSHRAGCATGPPQTFDLAQALGLLTEDGVLLRLLRDGAQVREVTITHRASENLRSALGVGVRRVSIGAVTGRLESLSGRNGLMAGVWPDRGGTRVDVRYTEEQIPQVRAAWYRRVSISGRLERDAAGRPVRIRMRSLEILPTEAPPLVGLIGMDPTLTGDLDTAAFLDQIRGPDTIDGHEASRATGVVALLASVGRPITPACYTTRPEASTRSGSRQRGALLQHERNHAPRQQQTEYVAGSLPSGRGLPERASQRDEGDKSRISRDDGL